MKSTTFFIQCRLRVVIIVLALLTSPLHCTIINNDNYFNDGNYNNIKNNTYSNNNIINNNNISTCRVALEEWALGMRTLNPISVAMFSASAKTIFESDLGSRDDCSIDFGAHYCLVSVKNQTKPLFLGFCLPTNCSEQDILTEFPEFLTEYLGILLPSNITLVASCSTSHYDPDVGAIVMFVIIGILVLLTIIGTITDLALPPKKDKVVFSFISNPGAAPNTPYSTSFAHPGGNHRDLISVQLVTCWSIPHNFPRLFSEFSENTRFLNGLRVISMFYVMLGHTVFFFFGFEPGIQNINWFFNYEVSQLSFQFIIGAFFAVDAFFFLSGLFAAYYTIETLERKGNSFRFWAVYFFHRFWRLLPTYMFVLFFWYKVTGLFGVGPLFNFEESRTTDNNCSTRWWTNLLFINNFIPWDNNQASECLPWSWYIATDTQLFLFSPIIFIMWTKNQKLAVFTILLTIIGGTATVVILTITHNLSVFNANDLLYAKPWTRVTPYIIGVTTGIVFLSFKQKARGFWWRPIFYILAAGMISSPIYGTVTYFQHGDSWSLAENVSYLALSRPSFCLGLALLSFAMFNGYATLIRIFLQANFWGPLSRLTFAAYLVHPIVMWVTFSNAEAIVPWTPISVGIYFVAFVVLSYVASLVVWLLIEKPFMNIEKLWVPESVKERKERRKDYNNYTIMTNNE